MCSPLLPGVPFSSENIFTNVLLCTGGIYPGTDFPSAHGLCNLLRIPKRARDSLFACWARWTHDHNKILIKKRRSGHQRRDKGRSGEETACQGTSGTQRTGQLNAVRQAVAFNEMRHEVAFCFCGMTACARIHTHANHLPSSSIPSVVSQPVYRRPSLLGSGKTPAQLAS